MLLDSEPKRDHQLVAAIFMLHFKLHTYHHPTDPISSRARQLHLSASSYFFFLLLMLLYNCFKLLHERLEIVYILNIEYTVHNKTRKQEKAYETKIMMEWYMYK